MQFDHAHTVANRSPLGNGKLSVDGVEVVTSAVAKGNEKARPGAADGTRSVDRGHSLLTKNGAQKKARALGSGTHNLPHNIQPHQSSIP